MREGPGLMALVALMAVATGSAFAPSTLVTRSSSSLKMSGMEAYEAQLRALSGGAPPAPVTAPAAPAAPAASVAPAAPAAPMGGDPIAILMASQQATVEAINAAIPDIAKRPDLSWGQGEVTVAGSPATLDARDAPGPANIAWLCSLHIAGKESSLTIFNGPLNNVPHLLSRVCIRADNTLTFDLDFRPRAYGAYELRDANGNYPGPEELGRKAFEYSGNRNDYFGKFVTDQVVAFLETTKASLQGCVENPPPTREEECTTRGPCKLSVTAPVTDANIATIVAAREQAANYWLGWAMDRSHAHRPGAPINTQYVYDSKYKINAYGALLPIYTALYGPADGATLTAAESGPLDEAYVGGGS